MLLDSEAARGQTYWDDGVLGRVWEGWLLGWPLSCCVLAEGLQEALAPRRHSLNAASWQREGFGCRVGLGDGAWQHYNPQLPLKERARAGRGYLLHDA